MNDQTMTGGESSVLYGYLAKFDKVDELLVGAARVRDAGYTKWDAHTPLVIHGLDAAMGVKKTILPYIVFVAGLTGTTAGILLQWRTNAVDYPYLISGKPYFSLPANVPVIFELTILLSAFAAFFGMLLINGLPRFSHPVFHSDRIARATDDRFFISIEAADPRFEPQVTRRLLDSLGGAAVEELREEVNHA